MQYRVIKYFIDRDTLKEYNAGDIFPCESTERASELIYKGYIERMQDKEPASVEKPVEESAEPTKTAKAKGTAKKAASKKKA